LLMKSSATGVSVGPLGGARKERISEGSRLNARGNRRKQGAFARLTMAHIRPPLQPALERDGIRPASERGTFAPRRLAVGRFGGSRAYFICPGPHDGTDCGRRITKLRLSGRYFLCRHCNALAYASQYSRGSCLRSIITLQRLLDSLHPSSSSTKAFARRVRRDAADPSRANAIRCLHIMYHVHPCNKS
jgi:hypothetical protein